MKTYPVEFRRRVVALTADGYPTAEKVKTAHRRELRTVAALDAASGARSE